ncbi:MAG TPA: SDR family NAD(P)-dependent oxidoreductase, partial [Pirellulaceae bacterium]
MARGLAAAGAHVVLVGRDLSKASGTLARIVSDGGCADTEPCDVTDRLQLEALRQRVHDRWGRIDILVNGAGTNAATPFLDISTEEFQRILSVNFLST